MIGGLIMAHSDDNGLVMPPKLATTQAIITTIGQSGAEDSSVINTAEKIKTDLLKKGIRAKVDDRDKRPGEKFFEWEKKGVPVRIELGPKDVANNSAILVRRDTGEKQTVALSDLVKTVNKLLVTIQKNLFKKALAYRKARTKKADSWSKFVKLIDEGNFVLAHWSGDADVETAIKDETGATVRCIPFDQPAEEGKCIKSGKPSHKRVIFAKSY
jgi:prolyl-tRNA synthetase